MLTGGSLFSGIGGLELGLGRAGILTLWQVEIDARCRAVLEKHWPEVERFADVRSVGAHNLRPVDVIFGGFPCQDISQAGQGSGIAGSRSGLWSEFARVVGELRPRYALVENVQLLRRRGLEVVLADLAALGYDAEWDCVPAMAVGAPHRRDRVWIVAHREREAFRPYTHNDRRLHGQAQELAADAWADALGEPVAVGADLADADSRRFSELAQRDRWPKPRFFRPLGDDPERFGLRGAWSVEPSVGRVAHGVPDRVDRLAELGNAVVPQVAEWIGRLIVADAESEEAIAS